MNGQTRMREWIARGLIAIVLGINLGCAIDFMARPERYLASYELSGEVGRAVIVGYGILFMMWQVPYFFALANPTPHRVSLISAVLMQAIGLVGESFLLSSIPMEHQILRNSILRFIFFDGGGLILLILALIIVASSGRAKQSVL